MWRYVALPVSDTAQKEAQNHVETWVRSLFALHGYPAPGSDQLGGIVQQGMARISPEELRHPGAISTASLGQLDGLVRASVEVGKLQNMYGADAARAAQAAGGTEGLRGRAGFGYIDALRARSSERFRELATGDSAKGTSPSGNSGAVTPEFACSFAGTGVVGGNLRTFSEVGLDRGTFNEFRKEGFSKEQIVDSAKDSKALHFQGKEDLSAAQHAPVDLRKASVAVEQAKTPEEKEKARQVEAEKAHKYEALPDSDKRKGHARRFIQRLEAHGHHVERHREIGARAQQHDATLSAEHNGKAGAGDKAAQDNLAKKSEKKSLAALSTNDADDWGATAVSGAKAAPAKPVPTKIAAAKPVSAGPTPS